MGERHSECAAALPTTPEGDDVRLVVTHRQLPDRDTLLSVSGGWHTHVDVLINHLKGDAPKPFWSAHLANGEEYDRRIPKD